MRIEPWLALLVATGCSAGSGHPGSIFTAGREPSPEIQSACDLAAYRCARCHPVDRILLANVSSPAHWVDYVTRMRHQPESNISEPEGRIIVDCLVFHTFGEAGLKAHQQEGDK